MSVAARARRPRAPPFLDPPGYARHRPEATLLYQLVEQHYPAFRELRAESGRPLPGHVQQEFEAYLTCGRLEQGFLRVRCEQCHAEKLVAFSCKKRGFCPSCGARRMAETAALTQVLGVVYRTIARGFSLHAGVDIAPQQREKLERLCRYISRPPVATERLALSASGQVRYTLKTPYRDGTTHIVLEPLELMARLAALVPPPRRHLTRFHGVFAPHSKLRAMVTPAQRGMGAAKHPPADPAQPPPPRHVAMSWAQRLKRVFGIEIDTCARCGGTLRIIASIEQPELIAKILAHLERTAAQPKQPEVPLGARAPPVPSTLR